MHRRKNVLISPFFKNGDGIRPNIGNALQAEYDNIFEL